MTKIIAPNNGIISHPLDRLQTLFQEWIDSLNLPSNISEKLDFNDSDLFLNFNYTETLENMGINSKQICYIHGRRRSDDKLVVGHNTDYNYYDAVDNNESIRENNERVDKLDKLLAYKKDSTECIRKNSKFFDRLKSVNNIVVLGHSYGDVDYEYYKAIMQHINKNAVWTFTYHTETDKLNALKLQDFLKIPDAQLEIIEDNEIYHQLKAENT